MFRRCLQNDLVKTNIFVLAIRLQDVFKRFSRRLAKTSWTPFQDVFKKSCKNVCKTSSRYLQDIFKTSSKCLQDVLKNVFKTFGRRLQDIFKTSCKDIFKTFSRHLYQDEYVPLSLTCSEDLFKTSWSRPIYSFWPYISKKSSRPLQDVLQIRLKDLFKTSLTHLAKTSSRHLQDIFKTFWRRLEDVFKTYSKSLQDVCKMPSRRIEKRLQSILKTSSRHLQDVLQRYLPDVFKTSLSRPICSAWSYVFRRFVQDVLVKFNIFALAIHLQDVFKTFSRRLA